MQETMQQSAVECLTWQCDQFFLSLWKTKSHTYPWLGMQSQL